MRQTRDSQNRKRTMRLRAFSLIEMALCLIIVGSILSVAIPLMQSAKTEMEEAQCYQRSQKIFYALAGYVLRHHHLPCPALDPHGHAEKQCFQESPTGYIPYHTLGLSADVAKSRHGRPFIYRVAGKLTQTQSLHEDNQDGSQVLGASFCAVRYASLEQSPLQKDGHVPHHTSSSPHDIAVMLVAPGPGSMEPVENTGRTISQRTSDQIYSLSRHGLLNAYGHYYCPSERLPDKGRTSQSQKQHTLW